MRAQIRGTRSSIKKCSRWYFINSNSKGALNGNSQHSSKNERNISSKQPNDTNVEVDRNSLNDEMKQLIDEVDRIAKATQFNEQDILSTKTKILDMQVGANKGQVS